MVTGNPFHLILTVVSMRLVSGGTDDRSMRLEQAVLAATRL
jgi:hypothetical protein